MRPTNGTTFPACSGVSLEYSTPGPVRQLVVTSTLTVGLSGLLGEVGLSVAGGMVAVTTWTVAVLVAVAVAVSVGVPEGSMVSVAEAVMVGVSEGV